MEGDNRSLKSHAYPPGTQQLLSRFRLSNFLALQTWFEFNDICLKSLRFELGLIQPNGNLRKKCTEEEYLYMNLSIEAVAGVNYSIVFQI